MFINILFVISMLSTTINNIIHFHAYKSKIMNRSLNFLVERYNIIAEIEIDPKCIGAESLHQLSIRFAITNYFSKNIGYRLKNS